MCGIAALTAGAGTIAIVLGIYDKCMKIIANPFKNFKENLRYIWPILLGILFSVACCAGLIAYLLANYNALTMCAFLGIIIGGIPELIATANKKGFDKKYLISMMVALVITIIMTIIASNTKEGKTVEYLSIPELIVYGAIYAWGAVMPGMTTIHILIFMGVLAPIIEGFTALNFAIIVPFGIGYIAIALTTANLITYLFNRFYGMTYYAIIGFSITSLFNNVLEILLGIIVLVIFAFIIFAITKIDKNTKQTKEKVDL